MSGRTGPRSAAWWAERRDRVRTAPPWRTRLPVGLGALALLAALGLGVLLIPLAGADGDSAQRCAWPPGAWPLRACLLRLGIARALRALALLTGLTLLWFVQLTLLALVQAGDQEAADQDTRAQGARASVGRASSGPPPLAGPRVLWAVLVGPALVGAGAWAARDPLVGLRLGASFLLLGVTLTLGVLTLNAASRVAPWRQARQALRRGVPGALRTLAALILEGGPYPPAEAEAARWILGLELRRLSPPARAVALAELLGGPGRNFRLLALQLARHTIPPPLFPSR